MSNLAGNFEVINRIASPVFQNTQDYDVAIYADSSNQAIHLGCGNNASLPSTVKVTSSNVSVVGDISFTGSLLKNGQAFQSGTQGLSNTSNAVYVLSGSNLGVGTSNPAQRLDVNGAIATAGILRIAQDGGLSNVSINASSIQSGTVATVRLPSASTAASGIVTLLDSTVSTSTSNAATPNAVKSAYDLAISASNNANLRVLKTGDTMTGGLVVPTVMSSNITASNIEFTGQLTKNGVPFSGGTSTAGLSNNGSNVFVASGSNFGVGTSTPQALLHVAGDSRYGGHLVPTSNLAYDLGTSNMRFRDLYLSGNTIDIGGAKITNTGTQITFSSNNSTSSILSNKLYLTTPFTNTHVVLEFTTSNLQFVMKNKDGVPLAVFQSIPISLPLTITYSYAQGPTVLGMGNQGGSIGNQGTPNGTLGCVGTLSKYYRSAFYVYGTYFPNTNMVLYLNAGYSCPSINVDYGAPITTASDSVLVYQASDNGTTWYDCFRHPAVTNLTFFTYNGTVTMQNLGLMS